MAVFAAIAFATFFLENDNFFTFNKGSLNSADNFGSFNNGSTNFHVTVGVNEKNTVECDFLSFRDFVTEEVDVEELAGLSLELLSLNFYDSVHLIDIVKVSSVGRAGEACAGRLLIEPGAEKCVQS